jgi:hypothetical protein
MEGVFGPVSRVVDGSEARGSLVLDVLQSCKIPKGMKV